jgi:hypothetical protein
MILLSTLTFGVFLVFFADEFEKLGVGLQIQIDVHSPGFGIHLGVVDCHLQVDVSEVTAPESFGQMKISVRGAGRISE